MHYVQVFRANGALEAEMIRSFLEAAGIPVRIFQESAGLTLGLTVGSLGEAIVSVPESYEAEARKQLEAMQSGELLNDSDLSEYYNEVQGDDFDVD